MDANVTASLIKNKRTTFERIEKFISNQYFTDVNLYGKLYPHRCQLDSLDHWELPGGEGAWEKWNTMMVLEQKDQFTPAKIGDSFGPSWSTHWFLISFSIPDAWEGKEVRFRWKSQSEAMIWSMDGRPLQGLSSGTSHQLRTDFRLSKNWNPKQGQKSQSYLIEMACSTMFGVGQGGMINPPNQEQRFTLEMAEICVFDAEVYSLLMDLQVLHDLAKEMSDDQRGYRALYAGNQMVNDIISGNKTHAQVVSRNFFSKTSGESDFTVALIGNCHIDSAWLWPYSETKRKCARSWAATIALMSDYPEMKFACSQAQQFQWVKETYPDLYNRIQMKSKDGQFIHVGSTWVEMDGLIPSGESFMRQFLYGQQFYIKEFGSKSDIFWLPDTFGYSGQIPQICKHFGIPYFLTQKLCWNLVNTFPHHTFIWEGIDGSEVLAHFPPGNSYEMNIKVEEVLRTEKNLADKGRVSVAGFLYGYGDGGGGPTDSMLEMGRRLSKVDGCPRLKHMTPTEMFSQMAAEKRNLCRWVGELFLELHNGTYTSQAQTKMFNRKCEFLLRKVELLLAIVTTFDLASRDEIKKRRTECEMAWKKVLLNQFHDVLPGSSIGMVYKDSDRLFKESIKAATDVQNFCLNALSPGGSLNTKGFSASPTFSVLNPLPWTVSQVFKGSKFSSLYGDIALEVPPFSFLALDPRNGTLLSCEGKILQPPSVLFEKVGTDIRLENMYISVLFNQFGQIVKLLNKSNKARNVFESRNNPHQAALRGNVITLYDDVPLYWDAWDVMDYHLETRNVLNDEKNQDSMSLLQLEELSPLTVELTFSFTFGSSTLSQKITLSAVDKYLTFETEVNWQESHKFLKVEFETGILARHASYEIQFGHLQRPTHKNTSWDSAKFEVCGQKWANISEHGCGLSLLNDSKYGWSAHGGTLVLSLLRAPKAPDEACDMKKHSFGYAAMPHTGSLQESGTMEASYEFNSPLSFHLGKGPLISRFLWVEGEGVMVEAVKVAEADERSVVVRLYEMYGGTRTVCVYVGFLLKKVQICDGMEVPNSSLPFVFEHFPEKDDNKDRSSFKLDFHPFQIQTVMLIR